MLEVGKQYWITMIGYEPEPVELSLRCRILDLQGLLAQVESSDGEEMIINLASPIFGKAVLTE